MPLSISLARWRRPPSPYCRRAEWPPEPLRAALFPTAAVAASYYRQFRRCDAEIRARRRRTELPHQSLHDDMPIICSLMPFNTRIRRRDDIIRKIYRRAVVAAYSGRFRKFRRFRQSFRASRYLLFTPAAMMINILPRFAAIISASRQRPRRRFSSERRASLALAAEYISIYAITHAELAVAAWPPFLSLPCCSSMRRATHYYFILMLARGRCWRCCRAPTLEPLMP